MKLTATNGNRRILINGKMYGFSSHYKHKKEIENLINNK